MITKTTCTSGGYQGTPQSYRPIPVVDCPPIEDPLRARQLTNHIGQCNFRNLIISGKNRQLTPGNYCGGIFITNKSNVTLSPGTYRFINGDLDVGGDSVISGRGINLNFIVNSRLFIRNASTLDLSAPTSGEMAGLLVTASRFNSPNLTFEVQSKNAKNFTGLVYTPNNTIKLGDDINGDGKCDPENDRPRILRAFNFDDDDDDDNNRRRGLRNPLTPATDDLLSNDTIGCEANVGEQSDWTAIIARNIVVTSGVELVLNSDYSNSNVPLPQSGGFGASAIRLSR